MCERKRTRAPGESDLRTPVIVAGVVEISADADRCAGKRGGRRTELSHFEFPELFIDRTEVLPAQTDIQSEVRFQLEIVLYIASVAIGTNVVPCRGESAGQRIEKGIFLDGSVVSEIPKISEKILRQSVGRTGVDILV